MSSFPEVLIMSLQEAEGYVAGVEDVCISIRAPGDEPARLSGNFRDVLRLWFDDTAGLTVASALELQALPFTTEMADVVVRFAAKHREARRLVVHCTAGISRSAAIGMALSVCFARRWVFPPWYGSERRRARYVHNKPVFDAVFAAFGRWESEQDGAA